MVVIRASQRAVLDELATSAFHTRLMHFLRKELPHATSAMDDDELKEIIERGEKRASTYHITSDAGIAQFVCLLFAAGSDFDAVPEIHRYLTLSDLAPEEKLDLLIDFASKLEEDPHADPLDVLLKIEESA